MDLVYDVVDLCLTILSRLVELIWLQMPWSRGLKMDVSRSLYCEVSAVLVSVVLLILSRSSRRSRLMVSYQKLLRTFSKDAAST